MASICLGLNVIRAPGCLISIQSKQVTRPMQYGEDKQEHDSMSHLLVWTNNCTTQSYSVDRPDELWACLHVIWLFVQTKYSKTCKATIQFCGLWIQVVFHDRENKHDFVKTVPGKWWNLCVFSKTSLQHVFISTTCSPVHDWRGVYWFHLVRLPVYPSTQVRLWTESCPFCTFNNTHQIHFIFTHLIKQLQKACHV